VGVMADEAVVEGFHKLFLRMPLYAFFIQRKPSAEGFSG
jgi:hypothetical protein